jgi:hypothetical protein
LTFINLFTEVKFMAQVRYPILFTLLALIAVVTAATAQAQGRQGFPNDSIVVATLPPKGRFQKLEIVDNTLQTEFGPGDPGYLGGRWWLDVNGDNVMDGGDMYFMCPLLAPGYTL